ncbi:MAG: PilZ domain-containing protein [Magnetococcales bacterium]|nr:PilZ domain-containing protein [Magnetococcales bacterium]
MDRRKSTRYDYQVTMILETGEVRLAGTTRDVSLDSVFFNTESDSDETMPLPGEPGRLLVDWEEGQVALTCSVSRRTEKGMVLQIRNHQSDLGLLIFRYFNGRLKGLKSRRTTLA